MQVLQVDGGTNPVLQTYVSMRGYAAVHRLSSALTQFPGNIMEQNLELELGRVRLVDISGSQVARQVRFTALLADMKGEEEFDAFRAEYQHELLVSLRRHC